MTIENTAMGEQPIFSCKAHVFHIDSKTKRSWIPASNTAVSVSFFFDSTRNLHRIISVEGTKAVINSTIIPNMTFTKTSQKFGQWSDVRANTVYGLGFGTEADLNKFVEKFQEIKEAARLSGPDGGTNPAASSTPITSANASPVISRAVRLEQADLPEADKQNSLHQRSHSLSGIQPSESPKHEQRSDKGGFTPGSSNEAQLKYENDRLKLALTQSSANAKKWEVELATLKTNNTRLTSALQESTANVEEWKLQLQAYKEENVKMRSRVIELESGRGDDMRRMADNEGLPKLQEERIRALEMENEQLRSQSARLQSQLDMALAAQDSQHKVLDTLNMQLGDKIAELRNIHSELHQAIQS